jgi:hypothetical protein
MKFALLLFFEKFHWVNLIGSICCLFPNLATIHNDINICVLWRLYLLSYICVKISKDNVFRIYFFREYAHLNVTLCIILDYRLKRLRTIAEIVLLVKNRAL